jgi:hypothetical protein
MISSLEMKNLSFQKSPSFEVIQNQTWNETNLIEKGAQKLHVFTHNEDHVYNSQTGYPNMISYLQTKNFVFQKLPSLGVNQNRP